MEKSFGLSALQKHSKGIPPSEVRLAEGVRYQDVISAVEVMDPRTDALFDHESIRYIADLMKSGEIFTADELTSLSESQILLFMQHMMALEAEWMQGQYLPQTVFSTPYIHHMRFLQCHSPMLYAYCLAVLKTVLMVFDTIAEADVKENEEFLIYHFGLDLHQDVQLDEVLRMLEEAYAEAIGKDWMQVAKCIEFQSNFLQGNLILARGHEFLQHASRLLTSAGEVLESIRLADMDDISLKKFYHPMTLRWVPALTPLKWISSISVGDGIRYFKEVIESLIGICTNFSTVSRCSERLLTFAIDFSASVPTLLVRSRLLLLIHSLDKNLLQNGYLVSIILHSLDETYGCSLYKSIYDGEPKALDEVYAMQTKKIREINKYLPQAIDVSSLTKELIGTQFTDFLERLARVYLLIIFVSLHNRARYRRRLANLFFELRNIQHLAWEVDTHIFGGGYGCVEHYFNKSRKLQANGFCAQCVACSKTLVLSALVTDIICRVTMEFNLLGLENNLYGKNEIPTAYAYNYHVVQTMIENDTILFHPQMFEPVMKHHARLYPLLVRKRRAALPTEGHIFYVEVLQLVSTASLFLHVALQQLGMIPSNHGQTCTTESQVYALRYKSMQCLTRPAHLTHEGYRTIIEAFSTNNAPSALENAVGMYQRAIEKLNTLIPKLSSYSSSRCSGLRCVVQANAVTAKLLHSIVKSSTMNNWTIEIQVGTVSLGNAKLAKRVNTSLPFYKLKQKTARSQDQSLDLKELKVV
ncbi:Mak10 subunit NatC N(alpha)terminal acetyltransferase [Perkinsela sp. CCAP 1560/4]|nr:Mak10 subunit NatC N(alpha)terminal acetyltransferase [Perkinsela sp. CCAP 1560/4]|eukprot:KNH06685.1 Mak10 subunit NatC N(alpha)terminal acetyltransferase [Perkinsela sp. CCAP 1560/4]